MWSSHGFGSTPCDNRPIQARVRCGSGWYCLNHATEGNSSGHTPKGTLSHLLGVLQRFVSKRFQVLFHSPPGVLFTFPSRYLSAIGHLEPKKDVGICDKPGGVDNRTVIPGCPNGETPPDARVIW